MNDSRLTQPATTPPTALSIAGSDSGGGAGIQADLLTFAAFGVFGTTAITAVTAQNTIGVQQVTMLSTEAIRQQIHSVSNDFTVAAVKTGMLGNPDVVDLVQELAATGRFSALVVDPVLVATTGAALFSDDARAAYIRLLPYVDVLTPNLAEAEHLLATEISTIEEMHRAARSLCDLGARTALVKGGHLAGGMATDVFCDGNSSIAIHRERIDTKNVHGTGCTLSAAITAALALGNTTYDAVVLAKQYVSICISGAVDWNLGAGPGPVNHRATRTPPAAKRPR